MNVTIKYFALRLSLLLLTDDLRALILVDGRVGAVVKVQDPDLLLDEPELVRRPPVEQELGLDRDAHALDEPGLVVVVAGDVVLGSLLDLGEHVEEEAVVGAGDLEGLGLTGDDVGVLPANLREGVLVLVDLKVGGVLFNSVYCERRDNSTEMPSMPLMV